MTWPTKVTGHKENAYSVMNIIIIATLLSGVLQILCDLGLHTNSLIFNDGKTITMGVKETSNTTVTCGYLGCLNMADYKFLVGDAASEYIVGPVNQTMNFTSEVTLSCSPVDENDGMVYWIESRNLTDDIKNFSMTGRFKKSDVDSDEMGQLTLKDLSGYDERWYVCILVKNDFAALSYGYLTVVGDPIKEHYNTEREDSANQVEELLRRSRPDSSGMIPGVIAAAVVFLVVLTTIIATTIYRRRRSSNVIVKYWMKKITVEKPQLDYSGGEPENLILPKITIEKLRLTQIPVIKGNDSTLMSEYQLPADAEWEILRINISLTEKVLGEGEFGKVIKAECNGIMSEGVKTVVAVKMLKDGHSDADMISMVSEMEIMKMIGKHENIINLLGCCTQDGPLYVVVEYARNGCLREFLKKHKPDKKSSSSEDLLNKRLTLKDLVRFSLQVARGMEYLASRGCIHRDLAARNVLVSADLVLKVADFGLARDVRDSDYYRKRTAGKLPMKWMAPESLARNMYTKSSDVWSFGVLMWEIMTFGSTPYPQVSLRFLYDYLKAGKRMDKPAGCSAEIYRIMRHCCSFDPEDRPTFVELVQTLKTFLGVDSDLPTNKTSEKGNEYH